MRSERFVLIYDDIPKSLNRGGTGHKRHWAVGYREKTRWEGTWSMLMLARKVPRGMSKVYVDAVIEVADNRKRDSENFRSAISKPLADALVKGGWLPDDTDEFFEMGKVTIRSGCDLGAQEDRRRVKGRTVLTLECEYEAA